MRISDWSSDVCSSDLLVAAIQIRAPRELQSIGYHTTGDRRRDLGVLELLLAVRQRRRSFAHLCFESGNALGVGAAADQVALALHFSERLPIDFGQTARPLDRKSTRLNSSH